MVRTNTGFNMRGTSSKLPPTLSWREVSIEGAITSYHTASARALAFAYVYVYVYSTCNMAAISRFADTAILLEIVIAQPLGGAHVTKTKKR